MLGRNNATTSDPEWDGPRWEHDVRHFNPKKPNGTPKPPGDFREFLQEPGRQGWEAVGLLRDEGLVTILFKRPARPAG